MKNESDFFGHLMVAAILCALWPVMLYVIIAEIRKDPRAFYTHWRSKIKGW